MTFVLGAGASKDFGFPIGWQLVDLIVSNRLEIGHVVTGLGSTLTSHMALRESDIERFRQALDASGQNSVDAFLEHRREFSEIGKAAISAILIGREKDAQLYQLRDPDQNWLRKLLSYMRSPSFEELSSNKVSCYVPEGAPMTKEPHANLDRLVSQIVLDCSLLRWFAFNHRRDDVMAAIMLQRTKARDTEGQVLDFLVRHCGGQQ